MKKLIKKRAALKAQLQTMLDKAKTEERAFSDDETKEFDRIEGEIKSIDATIEAEERANGIEDFHVPMATPDESKEKLEERAFEDYILGRVTEMRAGEQNMTMSNTSLCICLNPVTA